VNRSTGQRIVTGLLTKCLMWAIVLPLLVAATPPVAAERAVPGEPEATVIGTDVLYLRNCPVLTCQVVTSVPLSADVEITGQPVDGFTPVQWEGHQGWAYDLFLSTSEAPDLVRSGVSGCDRIALIFNAGIGEEPSEVILDTLVASQTPVTLFAMGWWAEEYPDYLHRMATGANIVIGSHGDTQLFLTGASNERIVEEVHNSAAAIEAVTGYAPARYYTPYATDSDDRVQRIIAGEGYLPVGWSVAAADYNDDDTAEGVYHRVMEGAEDGAIIEFHLDGPATDASTALALPRIIEDLEAQGYQLVTVPEILLPCPTGP
jgi:peptidoglycan-N-acetylglucosamine deacetylase